MAVRFDPSVPDTHLHGNSAERSSDILDEVIDALSEGLAVFNEDAYLIRLNAGFRAMNPQIADLLEPGLSWDILLREWSGRGGLPATTRERLAWVENRFANGEPVAMPIEFEVNNRVYDLLMRATATGGFVLVQNDITERLSFEENEREADMLLRQVLEACPANIVMTRVGDGEVIYRTPAATQLLGTAKRPHGIFSSREERADFITALLPDGRIDDLTVTGVKADGTRFPCMISARLIDYRGEDVMVSTTVDISKEVELRRRLAEQREQIFQAEKMSALGELLAGVAHELNNPLSVVVGHALMLRDENIAPETLRRVEKISEAAERCAKIVKSFLAMARQQPARLVPIDITDTLEMAIDALQNGTDGLATRIETDFATDLPPVRGDAHQIAQVLINLVTNADQAIRDSGKGDVIRVVARHDRDGGVVKITVADNGPGIPDKIQGRVFDPLFTTKPVGSGTGIGLALCHRIVTAHSGQIKVMPDKGTGAVIVVRLPTTTNEDAGAATLPGDEVSPSKGRILVVDDEEDVSDLIREILVRDGFEVEVTDAAETALEVIEEQDFTLILSDLNMPGIGGRGLYETLLRKRPSLARRVGFVTGDTMSPQARGFLDGAGRPYLEKPISPAELRKLAHSMLAKRGDAT